MTQPQHNLARSIKRRSCCTGTMLDQLLFAVPELRAFANLKLEIPFNLDSSRWGPHLHNSRRLAVHVVHAEQTCSLL